MAAYPHFAGRTVVLLDVAAVWRFGYDGAFGDATRRLSASDLAAIHTPENCRVPSAFDVAPPGVVGRRGTGFYRTGLQLAAGRRGRLRFAACSFYCRVFVDGVELAEHRSGGYTPFWVDVPASAAPRRELLVLADNRFNRTTAPVHTGGDFYQYGGLTRSVLLHELLPGAYVASLDAVPISNDTVELRLAVASVPAGSPVRATIWFDAGQSAAWVGQVGPLGRLRLPLSVPGAMPWNLWTEGKPSLHTVRVVLESGDAATARFGLRQLSVSADGRLRLNGAEVKLRGFNRHTMAPDTGSALSLDQVCHAARGGADLPRAAQHRQPDRHALLCGCA
jgi:beta-glucuronidase